MPVESAHLKRFIGLECLLLARRSDPEDVAAEESCGVFEEGGKAFKFDRFRVCHAETGGGPRVAGGRETGLGIAAEA